MSFTPEQQKAIESSGNILVSAGAGAGKTRTLVERCTRFVLESEKAGAIERILVVTFTDAAAAEVRKRIRERLEEETRLHPEKERLYHEIALLDRANISTLHSFCFSLVRENFFDLGIDPAASVLEQAQEKVLFWNTLTELLQEHYENRHSHSGEIRELIQEHFRGWDKPLIDLIRKLHDFTQTRPNPEIWLENQIHLLAHGDFTSWKSLYEKSLLMWRAEWLAFLEFLSCENGKARQCAEWLREAGKETFGETLANIVSSNEEYPHGKTEKWRYPLEKLFEEANFLLSLQPDKNSPEPLSEDWKWNRTPLLVILKLAREFAERFARQKRERGVLDFHDLEQFSLRLLWDSGQKQPAALARHWRSRFDALFIDEYQDINAAQDLILTALSRDEPEGNRFIVGDVKQSIYRFRQANPEIFQNYFSGGDRWLSVHLQENFRSHESILNFINPLFAWLMRKEFGGVSYDRKAELKFGNRTHRQEMLANAGTHVELHLLIKPKTPNAEPNPNGEEAENENGEENLPGAALAELEKSEKEAIIVARRLRAIKGDATFTIYDEKSKTRRRPEWSDMVVLLRSVTRNAEIYAKVFHGEGIPLQAPRDAFYTTSEVLDLCNLLHILDNPLQDIPLLGVLRSPLAGLTTNELAQIRLAAPKCCFWQALQRFLENKKESPARARLEAFVTRYRRWRDPRICSSLCQRLDQILADTGYAEWLLGQARGPQRWENVQQLLRIARQFDDARGESLYLFLRHIEELQETAGDIEPPSVSGQDAVCLMSIHKSKGLEFPIVALADLGKAVNQQDILSPLLLDDQFGLCSMIKPPEHGQTYPSLPLWLARRRQKAELRAEEIRILYVALTRAQNHLLLFGSTTQTRTGKQWKLLVCENPHPLQLIRASSILDWLGAHLTWHDPDWLEADQGVVGGLCYFVRRQDPEHRPPEPKETLAPCVITPEKVSDLYQRLSFIYPHEPATRQPAKTTVTALRREQEGEDEAVQYRFARGDHGAAQQRGLANHLFLQHAELNGNLERTALEAQAKALVQKGILTQEQFGLIDFASIEKFWCSLPGREILSAEKYIQRELPFTARITAPLLSSLGLESLRNLAPDEFIVVQGVADLAVLKPDEIWLLDFKTDSLEGTTASAAFEKYRVQLNLYACALNAIYKRPVTRKILYFLSGSEWVELA